MVMIGSVGKSSRTRLPLALLAVLALLLGTVAFVGTPAGAEVPQAVPTVSHDDPAGSARAHTRDISDGLTTSAPEAKATAPAHKDAKPVEKNDKPTKVAAAKDAATQDALLAIVKDVSQDSVSLRLRSLNSL